MNEIIDIGDLAVPELDEAQRAALAWGESVRVDFRERAILDAARARTGLEDFGADDFRERLRILREEWDGTAELTGLHRMVLHGYLVRYASNRLLIRDLLVRHPEIREVEISRPVIVVGLPRSGTTHIVNLLASDRRFHSLPLWESYEPLPLPNEAALAGGVDPRYRRCADAWAGMQRTIPLIAAMHPMHPDHVHEELELMGPDFASYNFEWLAHSPHWRDHYLATDQTPHYEYLKDVLRILQWRRGGVQKRWVLKCPQHLEQLPVLKRVFPDAAIVVTHRDPVAVIQSTLTMQGYTQRIHRRHVALDALIEYWPARIERLLQSCVRDRGLFDESHGIDLPFQSLVGNPMQSLERIYERADLEIDAQARGTFMRYLEDHPRGKSGQVRYHLERDFGISPAAMRRRFAFYFERFPVQIE
jgi:hypothetical protein